MQVSKKGLELIKKYEGCRLKAYKCPAGVWTIGYGHTAGVKAGQAITQEQAEQYLKADMVKYEGYVKKYVTLTLNQNQFDALVSFTYNCGPGNLQKLIQNRNHAQIANALPLYNKGAGKVLTGLVKRRAEEKALFLSSFDIAADYPVLKRGSTGYYVKVLQERLVDVGYTLSIDGKFGPATLEAVKAYQADHGLVVDGKVGPLAWARLNKG